MLIDTHAHFRETMTPGEIAGIMERARFAGVGRIMAVGCEPDTNASALRLAAAYPDRVKAAVAYDRSLAGSDAKADDIRRLIQSAPTGQVTAIGEIGLDLYYEPETAEAQQELMESQLALARELCLPVIVHSRQADSETLALLTTHSKVWSGDAALIGVLHCFTGEEPFARRLLDLGFMISFSGIVTFRNADPLRAVAKVIPDDRLLLETDSPYLTPVPHRGKPNEPCYLPAVAALAANIRGVTIESLSAVTSENATRLFNFER
ncbi:MAG: TatD family hydrolase [bacterium]|jgi:TatD DNase family protein